jgi:hypothetical protein
MSLAAGFVVIGVVSLGLPARAQDRSANGEAIAALADIESAIGELSESSDLMANTGRPYKQAAQRAAAAAASALDRLEWLTDHAGGNVWGSGVEGSLVNLRIAKGDLDAAVGTDGLEEFWSEASRALQVLLVAAGRESTVGVLGGLRGALATTTLGIPADASTVSGCSLPAKAPAYGVIDGYHCHPRQRCSSVAPPNRDQESFVWQRLRRPAYRCHRPDRPLVPGWANGNVSPGRKRRPGPLTSPDTRRTLRSTP